MKMRELEAKSGVGRETIRFYIHEGLLPEPERQARNVATYGELHVQRLKTIRRLQDERFLPLDIIKRVLDGDPTALPAGADHFPNLPSLLAGRLGLEERDSLIPLSTLTAGDRQMEADIKAFDRLGIISIRRGKGGRTLDRLDARIATLWRDIRRAGYGPDDFPAEFVELYAKAMAEVAAVEVNRFYGGFDGRVAQSEAAERAQAGVEIINALLANLRIRAILDEAAKHAAGSDASEGLT